MSQNASGRVRYELVDGVATVSLDDGKVNALSLAMLDDINGALDRATADGAVVVLTGREGVFSAGFDLAVLQGGGPDAVAMLQTGFRLSERLLSFPRPVVIACTGHAVAMGAFLLVSGDYRVGADGPFRIVANEVAIGLTVPRAAVEICRQRLAPAHFNRALLLAETYAPADAVAAGFFDRVVAPSEVVETANAVARQAAALDERAHVGTKERLRAPALAAIRAAMEQDDAALAAFATPAG